MNTISANDLAALGTGATVLGSGGGGDPAILYGQLHFLMSQCAPVPLLQPERLPTDTLIVPIALVGAPLVSVERVPNSRMFANLIDAIAQHYPNRHIAVMPAEIGGCNAFSPFMAAAQRGLPVVDGDLIGRAFPKLNMCKPAILGKGKQLSFIANHLGEVITIETEGMEALESQVRELVIQFGCSAAFATFLFNSEEQEQYLIPGSISRALRLGVMLQEHAQTLSRFAAMTAAQNIGTGLVSAVHHRIEKGFLTGYANIKTAAQTLRVFYQNEYLLVAALTQENTILAETPDIIALIETRSGLPLTSESLRYGLQVDILSLPAPSFWKDIQARSQVDLKAFDLDKMRYSHV